MTSFRTLALGAILTVALSATAQAQDPRPAGQPMGGPGGQRMSMADRALEGITLDDAQKARKDSIEKAWAPKLGEAREAMRAARESGGDMQAAGAKMRELQSKMVEEIKAVLTEEQKAAFDKNVEAMRARMQQMGGGRPPVN